MSSRWDDPNWWPAPRRQQKPPPSASKLLFGTLLPVVAVAGLLIALTGFKHSGHQAQGSAATAAHQVVTGPVDPRQAFEECMRSAGAGGGSRFGGGRFGGGPSQKFRQAFEVCRSLLQSSGVPLTPLPTTTAPIVPPVA